MDGISICMKRDRTRTVRHPDHPFTITVKVPTVTDLERVAKQFASDTPGFNRFVAKNWWLGFDGLKDAATGQEFANTDQVRTELMDVPLVHEFVLRSLRDKAAWLDEGNGERGAAS